MLNAALISYIIAVSFIGKNFEIFGDKPETICKSLTNFITSSTPDHIREYNSRYALIPY